MSRRLKRWIPTPAEVALARIVADHALRPEARAKAEAQLRERAHRRSLSLGEHTQAVLAVVARG